MDVLTGLFCIALVYLWFLFIDKFLKSCSHYGYIRFLNGTGLDIKFLQFKWTTTAFNGLITKWGTSNKKFLNVWFNLGLIVTLLLLPVAFYMLFLAFLQNFSSKSDQSLIIEPALPGVTLPASELGYYSLTLLISSVLHELGHGLAAAYEEVTLINAGANVIFILPVAYINVNSDKLFSLQPKKRLKVLCAGIWHNLVIAFVAYILYLTLPHIFSILYHYQEGVTVAQVTRNSPVVGLRGLSIGDALQSINDCSLKDENSWYSCLQKIQANKPAFCIEADLVHKLDESVNLRHSGGAGIVSCCHSENEGKLCFEYLDVTDSILEFPPYVCLPGRSVVESSKHFCSLPSYTCPANTYCFRPLLANNTNLFKIKRAGLADVIYLGPASDLLRTIQVSSYIPKHSLFSTAIPDVCTKFLGYLVVFSMGLAIVNVLPCIFMDGQHIITTILHFLFSSKLRTSHINVLSAVITICVTLLLVFHCVFVIWKKGFVL